MSAYILLVRHGQTDHNKERRVQGHVDIPLNTEGQQQAQKLARHLRGLELQNLHIHASDLSRAQATAQAVQAELGGTLSTYPDLREIFLGDWEGKLFEELAQSDPEHPRFWSGDPQSRPPGGETVEEVTARAWAHLQQHWPAEGQTLVLVSHGITLSALVAQLLQLDYQTEFQSRRYMHQNTGYSLLEVDPAAVAPERRQVLRAEVALAPHLE